MLGHPFFFSSPVGYIPEEPRCVPRGSLRYGYRRDLELTVYMNLPCCTGIDGTEREHDPEKVGHATRDTEEHMWKCAGAAPNQSI